jgi:hypothetical protein
MRGREDLDGSVVVIFWKATMGRPRRFRDDCVDATMEGMRCFIDDVEGLPVHWFRNVRFPGRFWDDATASFGSILDLHSTLLFLSRPCFHDRGFR